MQGRGWVHTRAAPSPLHRILQKMLNTNQLPPGPHLRLLHIPASLQSTWQCWPGAAGQRGDKALESGRSRTCVSARCLISHRTCCEKN